MGEAAQTRTLDAQLFRDVFNASPIGIAVENLDGQPLFVNPAFCSFLGFNEEELSKKHCVDFSPREDAEKDWALFQQLKAGSIDHYRLEKRYFRKDGSLVWGSLSISLLRSHPSPLVIAMVEDITDKKKAEEARYRHAALVESSDDAIASGTLDGIIVSWNTGAQKMYGYTEAEAVGMPINVLVPPELPDEEDKILEMLKAGGRIEHFETVRVSKMGKRINVSLTISPIKDSSGRTVGISGIARDITERKRADEALRGSEERLRLAQQAARIGTFEWNIETGVNTWTPELEAIYGLPQGGFGGTQTAFENLIHPDDRARVIELARASMKSGQATMGEWRVLWADGSVHWIAGRWQVFMNDSGEPSRMVGINIDITDRKRAEQEVANANERLHLAIEAASAGGWDFDLRTGKNVWFGAAHTQLGMAHDETLGSVAEFWARVHENDRARLERALQISNEKHEEFAEDFRVVWRDGTTHWLRSLGRHYYSANDQPERMLGICIDITESKQAEQALEEMNRVLEGKNVSLQAQEELLKVFIKNVPAAVAMLDRDMRYLQVSDRWCSDNSVEASELLGRSREDIPEMREHLKEANRRALQGEVLRDDEDRWESGGSTHWGRWEVRPWRNPDGTVGGILVFAEDITRRKQAEEALAGMTRKLIEAQEQERSRIGRELHDDINQRLALLAVELEQLKDNPSEVGIRVQELRKQVIDISNDVQALSHDLHSSKLEYLGVVAGMKSWCKEFSERHRMQIDFKSDVPTAVPLEIGLSLFRVLQEALSNAIKHSGVKRVEVQLREDSGVIHLVISDQGRGFDVEAASQGKGLGLTSMRERVRLVNGTISIESKPMGGTTIQVRVPLESKELSSKTA